MNCYSYESKGQIKSNISSGICVRESDIIGRFVYVGRMRSSESQKFTKILIDEKNPPKFDEYGRIIQANIIQKSSYFCALKDTKPITGLWQFTAALPEDDSCLLLISRDKNELFYSGEIEVLIEQEWQSKSIENLICIKRRGILVVGLSDCFSTLRGTVFINKDGLLEVESLINHIAKIMK